MSDNPDDLEELRRKRMEELQEQAGQGQGQAAGGRGANEAQEAAQQQAEAQRKAILRQNLTDDARKRLNTVKMSKPEFGEKVERHIISLAQSGRLQQQLDDAQMKQLLEKIKPESKSFDIKRR